MEKTNSELLAALLAEAVAASVHQLAPVAIEPRAVITHWRLVQVHSPDGRRTRHLVGRVDREGRVCSAIVELDAPGMRMTTESGRVYQLEGPPGRDWDGEYVFGRWKAAIGATHTRDLTRALMRLRQMHRGGLP
jgi:hypothetical protein